MSREDRIAAAGLVSILAAILIGAAAAAAPLPFEIIAPRLGPEEARFWIAVTRLGDAETRIAVGLLIAAWLWWRGWSHAALALLSVSAIETLAAEGLKEVFARARPMLVPHLDQVTSPAFPSGHAAQAAALYLLGAVFAGWTLRSTEARTALLVVAVLLVLLIGLSRVMLGVHWPSDVVGGWLLGLGFALLGLAVTPPQRARI